MKINLTKKEYRTLLDVIQIADWIINAHEVEDRKDTEHFEELFQKLLSYASEIGFADLIEHVKEDGKYYPTGKFESESVAEELIDEFENKFFWDELISRLAERDVLKDKKIDRLNELTPEEWIPAMTQAEELWIKEFESFDLDRIAVNQALKLVVN